MKKRIERTPRPGRERVRPGVVQTSRGGVRGDVAKHGVNFRLITRERRGEEFAQFGVRSRRRREKVHDFASQARAERRTSQPLAIPRQRHQRSRRAARALQRPEGISLGFCTLEGNGRLASARRASSRARRRRPPPTPPRLRVRACTNPRGDSRPSSSSIASVRKSPRRRLTRAETGRASEFEDSERDAVRFRRRRQRHLRRREVCVATRPALNRELPYTAAARRISSPFRTQSRAQPGPTTRAPATGVPPIASSETRRRPREEKQRIDATGHRSPPRSTARRSAPPPSPRESGWRRNGVRVSVR